MNMNFHYTIPIIIIFRVKTDFVHFFSDSDYCVASCKRETEIDLARETSNDARSSLTF